MEKELEELGDRKRAYDILFKSKSDDTHGSGVMEAIHLMAPQAQLLPIDMVASKEIGSKASVPARVASAIRKAIQYNADIINISSTFEADKEVLEACKEATQKGIPIIISAGNDSFSFLPVTITDMWDNIKNTLVKNSLYDLFQKLGGKGIRFAGALEYGSNGEEKVTTYTQHPSQDTEKHFIFAAGSQLPIHAKMNPDELVNGTSFSAPTVAGGYLLLKQMALDNKLSLSPERILDIMHESGRDVTYKTMQPFTDKIYKSMDLDRAKRLIEGKLNLKPGAAKTPAPKVAQKGVARPIVKPVPKRVAAKLAATAKAAPRHAAKVPAKRVNAKSATARAAISRATLTKTAPRHAVKVPAKRVNAKSPTAKAAISRTTLTKAAPRHAAKVPAKRVNAKSAAAKTAISRTTLTKAAPRPAAKVPAKRVNAKSATAKAAISRATLTKAAPKRAAKVPAKHVNAKVAR